MKIEKYIMPEYSYLGGGYTIVSSAEGGVMDGVGSPSDIVTMKDFGSPLKTIIDGGTAVSPATSGPGQKSRNYDGTVTAPAIAFSPQTNWNTGFSANTVSTTTQSLSVSILGVETMQVTNGQVLVPTGTAAAPSVGGLAATTTGIAITTTPSMIVAIAGVQVALFAAADIRTAVPLMIPDGTGAGLAKVGGRIDTNTTSTGNTLLAGEEVLQFIAIPASTLTTSGTGVEIECWGTTAANANAKTIKLRFCVTTLGGTVLITNAVTTNPNGLTWHCRASVFRTGSNAQIAVGTMTVGTVDEAPLGTTPAEAEASAIRVELTATANTAPNDVVFKGMMVRYIA